MAGLVLHLHAQAADVHVHELDVTVIVFAPDAFQDLFPHQSRAGIVEKQLHDLELHLGQFDGLARLEQNTAVFVQHKIPADQRRRRRAGLLTRRHSASTRASSSLTLKGLVM